ncbi:unnamed protein product [Leptidea sinapis]|uniref:Uncharacterized protein n=2 Tax=Leptidea sinapis TaxID=189913 RepID=A0A5E4QPE1_9NEOP|nr:unnamed protein product [Leptidea sinapis]
MIVLTCTLEPLTETDDINARAEYTGLYAMSIILVLMFLAKFCFDLLFVYGVVTEKPGIIRAYFMMWTAFFLLSMFTFFLNAPHYSSGAICMEVIYICFNVYAILLLHSFYKQLNTREEV